MTKHPSRKVLNFRHLLGCDTIAWVKGYLSISKRKKLTPTWFNFPTWYKPFLSIENRIIQKPAARNSIFVIYFSKSFTNNYKFLMKTNNKTVSVMIIHTLSLNTFVSIRIIFFNAHCLKTSNIQVSAFSTFHFCADFQNLNKTYGAVALSERLFTKQRSITSIRLIIKSATQKTL